MRRSSSSRGRFVASSMIASNSPSVRSRSATKPPMRDRSGGIVAVFSQVPLTWRKKSSCGRTPASTAVRSIPAVGAVGRLAQPTTSAATSAPTPSAPRQRAHATKSRPAARAAGTCDRPA
jgi:hypothetical protein